METSRPYLEVAGALEAVGRRRRAITLAEGTVRWLTFAIAALLTAVLLGGVFALPGPMRWALLAGVILVAVGAGLWCLGRPLVSNPTVEQIARQVEQKVDGLQNALINSVQLAADPAANRALADKAIRECAGRVRRAELQNAFSARQVLVWSIGLLIAVGLLAGFRGLFPQQFSDGFRRIFHPGEFVPRRGLVEILEVLPGDTLIRAGQTVPITVRIKNPRGMQVEATLSLRPADSGQRPVTPLAMTPDGPGMEKFKHVYENVAEAFDYQIEIGGGQSQWYHVDLQPPVEVEGLDLHLTYPVYTGLKSKKITDARKGVSFPVGAIRAPRGTVVEVRPRLSVPVSKAILQVAGQPPQEMMIESGGKAFSGRIDVSQDGQYALLFLDPAGEVVKRLPAPGNVNSEVLTPETFSRVQGYFPIRAIPDKPPYVKFQAPGRDAAAAPGEQVALRFKAADDYGLSSVQLFTFKEGSDDRPDGVHRFELAPAKAQTFKYAVPVPKDRYREGDVIIYYAAATDNRRLASLSLGPQRVESSRFRIVVSDPGKAAKQRLKLLEELRRRIMAILLIQEKAKALTGKLDVLKTRPAFARQAAEIVLLQIRIRRELLGLGNHFEWDSETAQVRQVVLLLARNEAVKALQTAQKLAQTTNLALIAEPIRRLLEPQEKIIDVLRMLLGIVVAKQRQRPKGDISKPGYDIPPDSIAQALEKLRKQLEKFIEEQKKVIDGSRELAKKPVDDYTEADLKKLRELAAIEEKWENFLKEALSDLSQIPEQDFSNSSLLSEIVEVLCDVKMAKDALKDKSRDIFVALEDAGREKAEEIVTNIEKWLPDKPDRERWAMEQPTDQPDLPMSELPDQLEDMIGELLEEEEDVFDEMQDITSKWFDSIDKGIGWDALDGPISNMSAKGVTGNQLPNKSEIGGRSGEGRTGKAHGEMVEQSATGKGGRRTPTRLTPDPFQKGQVKDSAKEPAGGATGGGKVSGAGGEGLEGPVPDQVQQQMKRLAKRQAAIRNKAEKIQVRFKVNSMAIRRFVRVSKDIEDDLRNYRYHNALRRRSMAVKTLNTARNLLASRLGVQRDTTPQMPRRLRRDISDALSGDLPPAYAPLLRLYYERISQTSKSSSP